MCRSSTYLGYQREGLPNGIACIKVSDAIIISVASIVLVPTRFSPISVVWVYGSLLPLLTTVPGGCGANSSDEMPASNVN